MTHQNFPFMGQIWRKMTKCRDFAEIDKLINQYQNHFKLILSKMIFDVCLKSYQWSSHKATNWLAIMIIWWIYSIHINLRLRMYHFLFWQYQKSTHSLVQSLITNDEDGIPFLILSRLQLFDHNWYGKLQTSDRMKEIKMESFSSVVGLYATLWYEYICIFTLCISVQRTEKEGTKRL